MVKSKVLVFIFSGVLIGLFFLFIYLMSTVNPDPINYGNSTDLFNADDNPMDEYSMRGPNGERYGYGIERRYDTGQVEIELPDESGLLDFYHHLRRTGGFVNSSNIVYVQAPVVPSQRLKASLSTTTLLPISGVDVNTSIISTENSTDPELNKERVYDYPRAKPSEGLYPIRDESNHDADQTKIEEPEGSSYHRLHKSGGFMNSSDITTAKLPLEPSQEKLTTSTISSVLYRTMIHENTSLINNLEVKYPPVKGFRRSVSEMDTPWVIEEPNSGVILKIMDDNGRPRIEIKLGPNGGAFERNKFRYYRSYGNKLKVDENYLANDMAEDERKPREKNTVILLLPNNTMVFEENNHTMKETSSDPNGDHIANFSTTGNQSTSGKETDAKFKETIHVIKSAISNNDSSHILRDAEVPSLRMLIDNETRPVIQLVENSFNVSKKIILEESLWDVNVTANLTGFNKINNSVIKSSLRSVDPLVKNVSENIFAEKMGLNVNDNITSSSKTNSIIPKPVNQSVTNTSNASQKIFVEKSGFDMDVNENITNSNKTENIVVKSDEESVKNPLNVREKIKLNRSSLVINVTENVTEFNHTESIVPKSVNQKVTNTLNASKKIFVEKGRLDMEVNENNTQSNITEFNKTNDDDVVKSVDSPFNSLTIDEKIFAEKLSLGMDVNENITEFNKNNGLVMKQEELA